MTLAFEDRREQSCLAATPNCRPAVACLVHATFVKHLSCQRPVLASICKIVFRVRGEGKSFCAEHLTELTANLTGKPSQSWIGDWWEGRRVACLVSDLNGLTQSLSCPFVNDRCQACNDCWQLVIFSLIFQPLYRDFRKAAMWSHSA